MRIFKTKWFSKWVKKEKISNELLCRVVAEMEKGLMDANLGGAVYKKRIALRRSRKKGKCPNFISLQSSR